MANARSILFRIFYSTTFTTLFLVLIVITGISPADKIYESYKRSRLVDIFLDTGAYVIAAFLALFLYASRLFTNRSILRDIPKNFMPIARTEVPRRAIHRLIEECMASSAVIAYHAKPRARRIEVEVPNAGKRILVLTKQAKEHHHEHHLTDHEKELLAPRWGEVKHPGWHNPAAKEMTGLEYTSVLNELIDLVEAKAVSLAPSDPLMTPHEDGTAVPDPRALEYLTRPFTAGMRQYLAELMELGIVPDTDVTHLFIIYYERARFGPSPLSEPEFESLMRLFAELLRSMKAPDARLFDADDADESYYYDDAPEAHLSQPALQPMLSPPPSTLTSPVLGRAPASSTYHDSRPRRMSEDSVPSLDESDVEAQSLRTARTRRTGNRSASRPSLASRYASASSRTSRPGLRQVRSQSSGVSRWSERSQASVIRLARPDEAGSASGLPYVLQMPQRPDG